MEDYPGNLSPNKKQNISGDTIIDDGATLLDDNNNFGGLNNIGPLDNDFDIQQKPSSSYGKTTDVNSSMNLSGDLKKRKKQEIENDWENGKQDDWGDEELGDEFLPM